jgi:hypothetical protein
MGRRGRVWQEGRKKNGPLIRGAPWYFVIDIAPPGAKRSQVFRRGFTTKEAAQDALDELVANGRAGTHVEPSRDTFGRYLRGWLDGLGAKGLRASTIAGYRSKLKYVLDDDVANIALQALTATDLDRLYGDLVTRGRRNGKNGLSLRTVRHMHTIVGKAFTDAERQDLINRNPARRATPPSSTAARSPEASTWTPEQLRAFLDAACSPADTRKSEHHHAALFRLAGLTGMRRGELCGLRWSDVDLDGARLVVRRTITSVNGELLEGDVKTSRTDARLTSTPARSRRCARIGRASSSSVSLSAPATTTEISCSRSRTVRHGTLMQSGDHSPAKLSGRISRGFGSMTCGIATPRTSSRRERTSSS